MPSAERRFTELISDLSADDQLGLLCALLAATIDPSADVAATLAALDELASICPPTFDGIIDALFASGMFRGDSDDYHHPRNSLLHDVLRRRTGMPITLSVVAIEVGRRRSVEIAGIGLPGHFVVRDVASGRFADPFGGGVRYDIEAMTASWQERMGTSQPLTEAMVAPTPARQIVLRILNNLKHSLVPRDERLMLARLAPLRAAFAELADERSEHRQWMRHFN
jgi:regulator of sirC expression with transglutaminase-like and TPR domain